MPPRTLFSCFGVELEYMIVRNDTLDPAPWADRVLCDGEGRVVSDIERGPITWSNELSAHVIELKTSAPAPAFDGLSTAFAAEVGEINRRLAAEGARLLPTAMHPWMHPGDARLWTHEYSEVYAAFDRIFDCRGHGWSNLQSVHLNLPFTGDAEFARLHAAVRLVLPMLPALAASSPFVEGRATGLADNRLDHYRRNSARLPAIAGRVIPEPVYSRDDYDRVIFAPIREALAPHDPAGVLEDEFSNARGAIARFARGSIEIRVLDIQECPAADIATLRLIVAVLRELVAELRVPLARQQAWQVGPLADLFLATVAGGAEAPVTDPAYLRCFGLTAACAGTAGGVWARLAERHDPTRGAGAAEAAALETILRHGPLSRRLRAVLPEHPEPAALRAVYAQLADCLENNRPFLPAL
jgi:glutamate---cysteine ligase / carboxylate-amine ligase